MTNGNKLSIYKINGNRIMYCTRKDDTWDYNSYEVCADYPSHSLYIR